MTALALGRAHGIVVHRHTRPARITVTRLATIEVGVVRRSGFIGRMTARDPAAGHYQTVINRSTGKGRRVCVTDRTVLSPDIGMHLVGRRNSGRYTTRYMTAFTLRGTYRIMVHRHTGPARITVTRFTTVQTGMIGRTDFIRRMTTTGSTTRNNKGVIHLGPDKRRA